MSGNIEKCHHIHITFTISVEYVNVSEVKNTVHSDVIVQRCHGFSCGIIFCQSIVCFSYYNDQFYLGVSLLLTDEAVCREAQFGNSCVPDIFDQRSDLISFRDVVRCTMEKAQIKRAKSHINKLLI